MIQGVKIERGWRGPGRALLLLAVAAAGPVAHADYVDDVGEVALHIERFETDLDFSGAAIDTRFSRIRLVLFEGADRRLQPALQVGALEVTQTGNSVTAGMGLTGAFIGLKLRSELQRGSADLRIEGTYAYHSAEDSTETQKVRLSWHEAELDLEAGLQAGNARLALGGYLQGMDGDETARGTVTRTRGFQAENGAGALAGVDYHLQGGGLIGLRAEVGARRGVELIFARSF